MLCAVMSRQRSCASWVRRLISPYASASLCGAWVLVDWMPAILDWLIGPTVGNLMCNSVTSVTVDKARQCPTAAGNQHTSESVAYAVVGVVLGVVGAAAEREFYRRP